MFNVDLKWYFNKDRINYIVKEYLGCDNDYILDNLDFIYQVIDTVYYIIDKYKNDKRNIQYIFESDYIEGRASDNINNNWENIEDIYTDLKYIENVNGIIVYEEVK